MSNLPVAELANDQGAPFGSKVIAKVGDGSIYTDRVGISGAKPSAIIGGVTQLGYQSSRSEWIMRGGNEISSLAGSPFTDMHGAAADINGTDPLRDSTNESESNRAYGRVDINPLAPPSSGNNSWISKGSGEMSPGQLMSFVRPSGAGNEESLDTAANTTRSAPGKINYNTGASTPTSQDYRPQDAVVLVVEEVFDMDLLVGAGSPTLSSAYVPLFTPEQDMVLTTVHMRLFNPIAPSAAFGIEIRSEDNITLYETSTNTNTSKPTNDVEIFNFNGTFTLLAGVTYRIWHGGGSRRTTIYDDTDSRASIFNIATPEDTDPSYRIIGTIFSEISV
jgi:hypothetical protein